MFKKLKQFAASLPMQHVAVTGMLTTVVLLPSIAAAQAITIPEELTDAGASVLVIGAAVFAIAVGVKLYKWIKAAL